MRVYVEVVMPFIYKSDAVTGDIRRRLAAGCLQEVRENIEQRAVNCNIFQLWGIKSVPTAEYLGSQAVVSEHSHFVGLQGWYSFTGAPLIFACCQGTPGINRRHDSQTGYVPHPIGLNSSGWRSAYVH